MIAIDWTVVLETVRPLGLFVVGMVIYSVFVYKFYKFLAKRNIITLNLQQYNRMSHAFFEKMVHFILFVIEYIVIMPVLIFFWFIVLAVLITFLAESQPVASILLVSMALVGAVRVCSYYSENLAQDLAKMLPFALLGVYIINVTTFEFRTHIERLQEMPTMLETMIMYLGFVMALELIMRIIHFMIPIGEAPLPEE